MTEETNLDGIIVYKCMKCGFLYKDEITAQECEQWCKKHESCNVEIIKQAVKMIK